MSTDPSSGDQPEPPTRPSVEELIAELVSLTPYFETTPHTRLQGQPIENDYRRLFDRTHEVLCSVKVMLASHAQVLAEKQQLIDAIFPKLAEQEDAAWWTVKHIATLAEAHREDSEAVDEVREGEWDSIFAKAKIDRQAENARLKEALIALRAEVGRQEVEARQRQARAAKQPDVVELNVETARRYLLKWFEEQLAVLAPQEPT